MTTQTHVAQLRRKFEHAVKLPPAHSTIAFAEREARIGRAGYDYFRAHAAESKSDRQTAARFRAAATDHAFRAVIAAAALQQLAAGQ